MTTQLQATTNRANAAHSTGPKTLAGKARSGRNALRHGLRSELPVLPGEDPHDWQTFRDGIVASLAPANPLEEELAVRVALCLWRLRRTAAFEVASTAEAISRVAEETQSQAEKAGQKDPFDDLRASLGEAAGTSDDPNKPYPYR